MELISKVPPTLHTPLMSGSNAISGITLVGAVTAAGAEHSILATVLGFAAVVMAMINVVGGFLVTHRMLHMFSPKRHKTGSGGSKSANREDRSRGQAHTDGASPTGARSPPMTSRRTR